MSKEIYISSTPHETRLAIVENDALTEIYYERENEYTLAGSIYNGKVTRVLPGMQSSFVDIGLERDAFLYITDFMEEAGDSADFDTSGNGDSRRRNGSAPIIEGTLATDQATDSGNRSERTDRNGRGDRGRGRGTANLPMPLRLLTLQRLRKLQTLRASTATNSASQLNSPPITPPSLAPTKPISVAKAPPEPMAAGVGVAVVAVVVVAASDSVTNPRRRPQHQPPKLQA
jgi:Ribonuclease G/E